MDWITIFSHISRGSILLPLLIGLILWKKIDLDSRLIFFVVLIGTPAQIIIYINSIGFLSESTNDSGINFLYNIYTPIEFFTYLVLFIGKISKGVRMTALFIIAFIFSMISVYIFLAFGLKQKFHNNWVIVNNLFQIIMICICLSEYYYNNDTDINLNQPFFWFLVGITVYSSSTTVYYSLWYLIKNSGSTSNLQSLDFIHHFANTLLYLCFSFGLLANLKSKNDNRAIRK